MNRLAGAHFLVELLHDFLHLGKTGVTIKLVAVQGVQGIAIVLVKFVQLVQKADALGDIVAEHFADQASTVDAILIPDR